jgi:hypothetical protein
MVTIISTKKNIPQIICLENPIKCFADIEYIIKMVKRYADYTYFLAFFTDSNGN